MRLFPSGGAGGDGELGAGAGGQVGRVGDPPDPLQPRCFNTGYLDIELTTATTRLKVQPAWPAASSSGASERRTDSSAWVWPSLPPSQQSRPQSYFCCNIACIIFTG